MALAGNLAASLNGRMEKSYKQRAFRRNLTAYWSG